MLLNKEHNVATSLPLNWRILFIVLCCLEMGGGRHLSINIFRQELKPQLIFKISFPSSIPVRSALREGAEGRIYFLEQP